MRSFIKTLLVPCITLALSALALQACSSDTDSGSQSCIPNSTQQCTCTGTDQGVQTCQANGQYNQCTCGNTSSSSSSGAGGGGGAGGMGNCHALPNTPETCGNGMLDMGEECDDGNCVATDACNNNCRLPYCGDGVITPSIGETCEGEVDCSGCGIMATSSSSSSSSGDPCAGKLIFAGFAAAQTGAFSYGGQIGLDAAAAACQAIGGFGMCDYDQWKQIETAPMMHPVDVMKLGMTIPAGTCQGVWLQRTTVATTPNCPGGMAPFGPGGNCNNWNYETNHISDGEWVEICNVAGTITFDYKLDCDPVFDVNNPGPHQNQALTCVTPRPIPCCYEKCVSP
jgi:cysteine-rich repeat protein